MVIVVHVFVEVVKNFVVDAYDEQAAQDFIKFLGRGCASTAPTEELILKSDSTS
jgi:hypothetical protein